MAVADAVGTGDPVSVGTGVSVPGAAVSVAVLVSGAVVVAVGRGVTVTSGSLPTRRTIWTGVLGVPAASRTRAVMMVAPPGKASTVETGMQNWARVRGSTKRWTPKLSKVQAWNGLAANSKRQPMSLKASFRPGRGA